MSATLPVGYCFESIVQRREVSGLRLLESRYRAGQRSVPHVHAAASFCLVLQGRFVHFYRGKTERCEPRSLLFYRPGEPHAERFLASGARCFILELSEAWLARLSELEDGGGRSHPVTSPEASNLAWRVFREMREPDGFTALVIEGLALELMGETLRHSRLARREALPPTAMECVRDMIHAAAPGPVSLGAIGATLGLHPVHVANAFRRRYGCSVGQYARRLRVDLACRRLASSREPLRDIAVEAGFYDQSHMTREFRRILHTTPARYRTAVGGQ